MDCPRSATTGRGFPFIKETPMLFFKVLSVLRFLFDPIYFTTVSKRLMVSQIEVFLEWGRRNSTASMSYQEWLDHFLDHTQKTDFLDVTYEDIDLFIENNQDIIRTRYSEMSARKALDSILRFYMARSKNGKTRLGRGRPAAIEKYELVGKLRKKGISFRDIGILIDPKKPVNRSNVFKWWSKFKVLKGMKTTKK